MRSTQLIFLLFTQAISANCVAQYNETIRSLRPGQGITPYTVGRDVFQMQAGVDIGGFDDMPHDDHLRFQSTSAALCQGLTNRIEANIYLELRHDKFSHNTDHTSTNSSGLSFAAPGFRFNVFDGKGKLPTIGIQSLLKLSILSKDYNPNYLAPRLMVLLSQNVTGSILFTGNFGLDYDGFNVKPNKLYAFSFSFTLTDKLGTFVETYGSFRNDLFFNHFDAGLSYLATKDVQLDLFGGTGRDKNLYDYFLSLGISYRCFTSAKGFRN
jgi:hypothetical protein